MLGSRLGVAGQLCSFLDSHSRFRGVLGNSPLVLPQVTPRPGGSGTWYTGSLQPLLVFVRQYFTVSLWLVKYSHCFCHCSLDPQSSASICFCSSSFICQEVPVSAGHPTADSQSGLFELLPSLFSPNAHLTHLSKCHP